MQNEVNITKKKRIVKDRKVGEVEKKIEDWIGKLQLMATKFMKWQECIRVLGC